MNLLTHSKISSHSAKRYQRLLMIILLCLNGNTWAKSFDLYSDWNVELELHSEAQLDHYIDQDCDDISCDDLEDEWRVVDIEGRLKSHIFNHWLVFTDVKWSFGNEDAPIANVLQPTPIDTSIIKPDDSDSNEAVIGLSFQQHVFTWGKHQAKTNSFGPSTHNYLGFGLSGFDDDRIDWFSYEIENSVFITSSGSIENMTYANRYDINGALGVGVEDTDPSKISLDYDFLLETTIPGIDNLFLSMAIRSMSKPNSSEELKSYGIKVSAFTNQGTEFTAGFTNNDFGDYIEFSLEHIWQYRNKVTVGWSDFNAESDTENSTSITDANFLFFSYTCAISEQLDVFGEYSGIDTSGGDINSLLLGFKMSF